TFFVERVCALTHFLHFSLKNKIYNFKNSCLNFVGILIDTKIKLLLRMYKCGAFFATSVEFSNACLNKNRAAALFSLIL
ncbi:MAG: hypothetical protein ACPGDA_07255, partial [Paracoccaceae bacterium]